MESFDITKRISDSLATEKKINSAKIAIKYFSQEKNKLEYADNSYHLAELLVRNQNYQAAINYLLIARKLNTELERIDKLIEINNLLGRIYLHNKFDSRQALEFFFEALNYSKNIKNQDNIGEIYNNLSQIYLFVKDYSKASVFAKRSYSVYKGMNDSVGVALSLNTIGRVERGQKNYEKAISYFKESLQIHKLLKCLDGEALNYKNMGLVYFDCNDLNISKELLLKSLNIYKGQHNTFHISENTFYLGKVHFLLNEIDIALDYLKQSLMASKSSCCLDNELRVNRLLSEVYEKKDDFVSALNYFKSYTTLLDSLKSKENAMRLNEMRSRFNFTEQQKELQIKDQENFILKRNQKINKLKLYIVFWALSFVIILGVIIVKVLSKGREKDRELLTINTKKHLEQKEIMEAELKNKQEELTNLAIHIAHRNEFMNKIQKSLKKLEKCPDKEKEAEIKSILLFLNRNILINQEIAALEHNIDEHLQDFFDKLTKQFPDLTRKEQQLCGLLRLNLSTKDIASIRNSSVKAVEMGRYRLRSKLGLQTTDKITEFLQKI
ncbi:MAG: tetratricopeptide repeat protein [Hyphomicrobiales bacterium]